MHILLTLPQNSSSSPIYVCIVLMCYFVLQDENNSDTDDASLATIHTTAGGSMGSAMPTGQLVNEEETIDDSDAVFHDFR